MRYGLYCRMALLALVMAPWSSLAKKFSLVTCLRFPGFKLVFSTKLNPTVYRRIRASISVYIRLKHGIPSLWRRHLRLELKIAWKHLHRSSGWALALFLGINVPHFQAWGEVLSVWLFAFWGKGRRISWFAFFFSILAIWLAVGLYW